MALPGTISMANEIQRMQTDALHELLATCRISVFGNLLAQVLCVTSSCQTSDACHEALRKAFVALGYEDEEFCTASIAEADTSDDDLLCVIESIDPLVVVSIDKAAACAVSSALKIPVPSFGMSVVGGTTASRRFVAIDDFEASLASQELKRVSWHQLKAARRRTRFM